MTCSRMMLGILVNSKLLVMHRFARVSLQHVCYAESRVTYSQMHSCSSHMTCSSDSLMEIHQHELLPRRRVAVKQDWIRPERRLYKVPCFRRLSRVMSGAAVPGVGGDLTEWLQQRYLRRHVMVMTRAERTRDDHSSSIIYALIV